MNILTRMCISLDGYVTTPDGWPVQLADPNFSPEAYGFTDFQKTLGAVLMGRTTFEPALNASRWPWPDLDVFVLASERPTGTPEHVVTDGDPEALLDRIRNSNRGGDGMRLTPALSTDTALQLETERALPGGLVEIVYEVRR